MTYKFVRPILALKGLSLITSFRDDELCGGRRKAQNTPRNILELHSIIDGVSQKINHDLLLVRGAPGVVVGVAQRGKIIWKAGFGYADVENLVPCRPDSVMRIASISKSVTMSTIVAKMLESGQLNLDDSIHKYLTEDEFPKQKFEGKEYDIKLRHLLSNTSGIRQYGGRGPIDRDYVGEPKPIGWPSSMKVLQTDYYFNRTGFYERTLFRNVIDSLKIFKDDDLACVPGSRFVYSTQGWVLVSAIVQKALSPTGVAERDSNESKRPSNGPTFESKLLEMLRHELKLQNIHLEQEEPMIMFRTKNYQRNGRLGRLINCPSIHQSCKWSGGGMLSNTEDLLKLASMLIDSYKSRPGAYLKASTVKEMWTDQSKGAGYGFGFRSLQPDGSPGKSKDFYVYHTGAAVGGSSILTVFPESEIVVCIIVNIDDINLKDLSLDIARAFGAADDSLKLHDENS